MKSRPASEVAQGQLNSSLDALEKLKWFSSSEPRDLYALYLRRRLPARARRFRELTLRATTLGLAQFFDMADQSPQTYVQ